MASGAKGDHQVRVLDSGAVIKDEAVPAAADPAGMPVPLKDVLPMPSEALQGVPALVVVGKAQAGRLNGAATLAGWFEQPQGPSSHTGAYSRAKKRGMVRILSGLPGKKAQVYFLGTIVTVC